jgi:hypothetical protein
MFNPNAFSTSNSKSSSIPDSKAPFVPDNKIISAPNAKISSIADSKIPSVCDIKMSGPHLHHPSSSIVPDMKMVGSYPHSLHVMSDTTGFYLHSSPLMLSMKMPDSNLHSSPMLSDMTNSYLYYSSSMYFNQQGQIIAHLHGGVKRASARADHRFAPYVLQTDNLLAQAKERAQAHIKAQRACQEQLLRERALASMKTKKAALAAKVSSLSLPRVENITNTKL